MPSQFIGPTFGGTGGGGGGGGAPTDATYVVGAAHADLSAELVLGSAVIIRDSYDNIPAASLAGRLFMPSNGMALYRDSGSAWNPSGPIFPATAVADGDFSWVNQGTATQTTLNGGVTIIASRDAGHVESFRMKVKTAPATPYTIIAGLIANVPATRYGSVGLVFRKSSDGHLTQCRILYNGSVWAIAQFQCDDEFGAGAVGAFETSIGINPPQFFALKDDGTDKWYGYSSDGQNIAWIYKEARTVNGIPNQVGWFVGAVGSSGSAGYDTVGNLFSWREL